MIIKISMIVPIYNLEHLLSKCIDSILVQTFTDFELILVNDGSTDKSGEICDEYAKADSRIKIIHKKNGGTASSRNAGLEVAKGNYIGFVDNDDFINEHMLEILYKEAAVHSSDIIVCDFLDVDEGQYCNTKKLSNHYSIRHFNHMESLNQLYTPNNVRFVVPWNKLYKRHLFENIKYKHGSINDDETVAHELLYASNKTTYIQAKLYYYVHRKGSQMNSTFHIKRFDAVYALKEREDFFRKIKEPELHHKALKHYMEEFFWYYYMAKMNLKGVDKELKELKRTFNKSLFFILKHNGISFKQRTMCLAFRIHPLLFELIRGAQTKSKGKQQSGV